MLCKETTLREAITDFLDKAELTFTGRGGKAGKEDSVEFRDIHFQLHWNLPIGPHSHFQDFILSQSMPSFEQNFILLPIPHPAHFLPMPFSWVLI